MMVGNATLQPRDGSWRPVRAQARPRRLLLIAQRVRRVTVALTPSKQAAGRRVPAPGLP